jgi:maleate isomerase
VNGATGPIRLGIVIPAANATLEAELPRFGPDLASWHFQRFAQLIRNKTDLAAGMAAILDSAAALPAARVRAIGVGYTAGSYAGGPAWDASLRAALAAGTGCPVHTAASAIVGALERLAVRSVAMVSPYSADVNRRAARYLTASGFTVTRVDGEPPPGPAGDVAPDEIEAAVRNLDRTGADAVLISCTGLRTLALITDLEQAIGLPVVSSNLALLWAMTAEAGLRLSGPGSLT